MTQQQANPMQDNMPKDWTEWYTHWLEAVSPEQRAACLTLLQALQQLQVPTAGMPPAHVLNTYNTAFPDGAARVFDMLIQQYRHAWLLEEKAQPEWQRQSRRGQLYGLIIALSFLAAAVILICLGHGIYGTVLGTVDLVALVTVFVIGRQERSTHSAAATGKTIAEGFEP